MCPRGVHEALRCLKRRGIVLACVSKNDEAASESVAPSGWSGIVDRIHELVSRTNRFNTTTRRYQKAELRELVDGDTSAVYSRITAKYIPTDRNGPARNLLPEHGFVQVDQHAWELARPTPV
jgi:predicted enzyme involved in methoxymalonyl-ACP biosynthesis